VVKGQKLKYIPFQFYGSENNKPTYDRPAMFDLAHQNLGHFEQDCNDRDNLNFHGQGMTNIYTKMDRDGVEALNPTGIDVGAKGMNIWDQGDRVEILQPVATGAIGLKMQADVDYMVKLGAQIVQDSSSTQTLGAKKIESNGSMSQLKRISLNTSAGLTQNLRWCAEFAGANPDEVTVKVNTKFVTDDLTAQDVQAVFAGVQGGLLPDALFLEAIRKAGYSDKTDDEINELIEDQARGQSKEMAELTLRFEQLEAKLNGSNE
jgi:sulfur carrier protein ThiS